MMIVLQKIHKIYMCIYDALVSLYNMQPAIYIFYMNNNVFRYMHGDLLFQDIKIDLKTLIETFPNRFPSHKVHQCIHTQIYTNIYKHTHVHICFTIKYFLVSKLLHLECLWLWLWKYIKLQNSMDICIIF